MCVSVYMETHLMRFLFHYRTTLHSTTGVTLAEFLMGSLLYSHLDLLHPNVAARIHEKWDQQKTRYYQHS